jgi:uncharacterized membrane protein
VSGYRIEDSRAFFGGLALVIIGIILSLMTAFYLLPDVFGHQTLVARWWWEIVLNLQILCLAFMWFCHHNRLILSSGWWRLRAISHFLTGMVSVSYPVGVLLISAYLDWFREAPPPMQVYRMIFLATLLWAVGTFVMPIINWLFVRGEQTARTAGPLGRNPVAWLGAFWPTFLAILIGAVEAVRGGVWGLTLIPLLLYLQGALPYFKKAGHASPRDSDF